MNTHPIRSLAAALDALARIERSLAIDDALPPNDLHQIRTSNRVTTTAIAIAADVAEAAPEHFIDVDAAALRDAMEYDEPARRLAESLRRLAHRLEKSRMKRRWPAAQQTLVLYAALKSKARVPKHETFREKLALLRAEFPKRRKETSTAEISSGVDNS